MNFKPGDKVFYYAGDNQEETIQTVLVILRMRLLKFWKNI